MASARICVCYAGRQIQRDSRQAKLGHGIEQVAPAVQQLAVEKNLLSQADFAFAESSLRQALVLLEGWQDVLAKRLDARLEATMSLPENPHIDVQSPLPGLTLRLGPREVRERLGDVTGVALENGQGDGKREERDLLALVLWPLAHHA